MEESGAIASFRDEMVRRVITGAAKMQVRTNIVVGKTMTETTALCSGSGRKRVSVVRPLYGFPASSNSGRNNILNQAGNYFLQKGSRETGPLSGIFPRDSVT